MHELFEKYGLKHLSISQVKTIKRSPFAWVCEKILKRRGPPSEATTFGSFVHDNFERWLLHRIEKPEGVNVTEEAREFYVPAWDAKVFKFWEKYRELYPSWPEEGGVEADFSIELHEDLPPFIGKVDVLENVEGKLIIQDHKTIGNKSFAHKVPADVAADPQLNLYAHAFKGDNEAKFVRVQHNQLFKKIKREPVNILSAEVSWGDVDKAIELIKSDALEAINVLKAYDKLGIEGFAESVKDQYLETRWDFGGCPHWDFFQECLTKNNQPKYNEEKAQEGEDTMPIDLHELVGKARYHFSEQGLKKFDLADAIVEAVAKNLTTKNIKAVFIRDGEGGDLIYNQLLNQVAEKGIAIFKKVG